MRESIHKYFKVGTIQFMSYAGHDVLESIRKIACDDYFDAIEVTRFDDDETRKRQEGCWNSPAWRFVSVHSHTAWD